MSKLGLNEPQDLITAKNGLPVFLIPKLMAYHQIVLPPQGMGNEAERGGHKAELALPTGQRRHKFPGGSDKDLQPGSTVKSPGEFFQNTYPDSKSSESISESETLEFVS